jgi:hypothetical protein
MICLPTSSSTNNVLFEGRTEVVIDVYDYNRLRDLQDVVQYHDKLLSQYGYNPKTDQWDTKLFPVTQTDRQMEGLESDIIKSREAIEEYNAFLEYLKRKYDINTDKEEECIFIAAEKGNPKKSDKK